MKSKRARSAVLIASLLLTAAGLFLLLRQPSFAGKQVQILVEGEVFGTYSLAEDREIPVGDRLIVSIRDGKAFVASSVCPGQTCVHHAPIRNAGEMIVCLPGQVVVCIPGEADGELDAVL